MWKKCIYVVAILTFIAVTLVVGLPSETYAASSSSYNYARLGDASRTTLTAADIIESMNNSSVDEVEKAYLKEADEFALFYSSSIEASYISVPFDNDSGVLTVSAENYKYTAINGKEVVWTPKRATVNNKELSGSNGIFNGKVLDADGDIVNVEYRTDFLLPFSEINAFLNKAFYAGQSASNKLKAEDARYNKEYSEYIEKSEEYDRYLKDLSRYEDDLKVYEEYLIQYNAWKRSYDAYCEYLSDYAEYEKKLEAYNSYDAVLKEYQTKLAAYRKYLSDYDAYLEAMDRYESETSSEEAQKIKYHLSIMEYMVTPVTDMNRTLSGAIMGGTVSQVLEQAPLLETFAGADKKAIQIANNATLALRSLIARYLELSTDEGKYIFYINGGHEGLRKNFCDLLRTLDYLYSLKIVKNEINNQGKTRQYEILLAQLYYIAHALNNGKITDYKTEYTYSDNNLNYLDSSYRIEGKTPAAILGSWILEDKEDALPLETGYSGMPERPAEPTKVQHPGEMPMPPDFPFEPKKVEDPGPAPIQVDKPVKPDAISEPTEPVKYIPSERELALTESFDEGRLTFRQELTEDYILSVKKDIIKYFRNPKLITVRFYVFERGSLILKHMIDGAEYGAYIQYPYSDPIKTDVPGYICTFDYWVDQDDEKVDLNRLETDKTDLNLFPHFEISPIECTVFWYGKDVNNPIEDTCLYDSSPSYDESIWMRLYEDNGRNFRFIGWRNMSDNTVYYAGEQLPIVTGERAQKGAPVSYEAIFEYSIYVYWDDGSNIITTEAWRGDQVVPPFTPESYLHDSKLYYFTEWDNDYTVPVENDITFRAVFDSRYIIGYLNGGGVVTLLDGVYIAECDTLEKDFEIEVLMAIAAAEGASIEIRLPNYTLFMSTASVFEAAQDGVSMLTFDMLSLESYVYTYSVALKALDGTALTEKYSITLSVRGEFDAVNSTLEAEDAQGNKLFVTFKLDGDILTFVMRSGYIYKICPTFSVLIISSEFEGLTVTVSKDRAAMNETIDITIAGVPTGMRLGNVYVIDEKGNEVPVIENSFVMPKSAVLVGVICEYIEYNITFKSDGKILIVKKMHYGEQIVPPIDPIKVSDGEYEYTFVGWDKEFGTVTGDEEFNAVFTKKRLPQTEIKESPLVKLIKTALVVVPIVFGAIIISIVVLVVLKVKKRRIRK